MRTLLRAVTTRYGIAGLLVLAVLVTVLVTRLMGGEVGNPLNGTVGEPEPSISLGPDDGVVDPDDPDAVDGSGNPADTGALPSGLPDPRPVAGKFASAWADTDGVTADQWRDRLTTHATDSLKERLADAKPPSERVEITGKPRLADVVGRGYAEVDLETADGALRITLRLVEGRWAVDSIGWRDR